MLASDRSARRITPLLLALVVIAAGVTLNLSATATADETVVACGAGANNVFQHAGSFGYTVSQQCPSTTTLGLNITTNANNAVAQGSRAAWQANAPAGLEIVGATIGPMTVQNLNVPGSPWGGGVYWAGAPGGSATQLTELQTSGVWGPFASPYFGFQIVCGANPCHEARSLAAALLVDQVSLQVHETQAPRLVASGGLWQAAGWVRGAWPLSFSGVSPSGMCDLSATLDGEPIPGSTVLVPNTSVWQQCSATENTTVNTGGYRSGEGPMPLVLSGSDAAGEPAIASKTIKVDNTIPTLSLSGPTDAPTTAGTQYVTATAGDNLSGIDGISCSVDGGPWQWYAGASARVPVSGLGEHSVSCHAYNNAVAANGAHGVSAPQSWTMKIGAPTELGVGFLKYVGLRCRKVKERKTIPGHWVKRHWHHRLVKVKTRPRHKVVTVTKCHPKVTHERVVLRVPVRRHGKVVRRHGKVVYRKKIEHKKVVAQPHWKSKIKEHVKHGKATTVSGWLGLTDGTALGGHVVQILTAPDNGLGQFSVAATTTTAANGSWSATLPPGPSRIIEATYPGDPVTEATGSGQIKEIVRAKIKLKSIRPRRVAWGQTIKIKGRLFGGYLPPGGVNVRLRIGIANNKTTYGVKEHVGGNGRFKTTYTFGAGPARIHRRYWFQIATLPSSDYPYSPAHSGRLYVKVGGHPRHHHRHRPRRVKFSGG